LTGVVDQQVGGQGAGNGGSEHHVESNGGIAGVDGDGQGRQIGQIEVRVVSQSDAGNIERCHTRVGEGHLHCFLDADIAGSTIYRVRVDGQQTGLGDVFDEYIIDIQIPPVSRGILACEGDIVETIVGAQVNGVFCVGCEVNRR